MYVHLIRTDSDVSRSFVLTNLAFVSVSLSLVWFCWIDSNSAHNFVFRVVQLRVIGVFNRSLSWRLILGARY